MESQSDIRPMRAAAARRPFFRRRKSCPFSGPNAPKIDYKDVKLLAALYFGARQDRAEPDHRGFGQTTARAGTGNQAGALSRPAAVHGQIGNAAEADERAAMSRFGAIAPRGALRRRRRRLLSVRADRFGRGGDLRLSGAAAAVHRRIVARHRRGGDRRADRDHNLAGSGPRHRGGGTICLGLCGAGGSLGAPGAAGADRRRRRARMVSARGAGGMADRACAQGPSSSFSFGSAARRPSNRCCVRRWFPRWRN